MSERSATAPSPRGEERESPGPWSRTESLATFLLALLPGMLLAGWPLVRSGFADLPGDLGDARFIQYLLEHSWLWVTGDPQHRLWDPPFYFPVTNVGAYSDIMVASGPIYWLWRAIGVPLMDAYQLWVIVCLALNFVAGWLILRQGLSLSPLASSAGALLFSFGSPRLNQLNHLQLLPQFFVLLSLYGVIMLIRRADGAPPRQRALWIACAYGGIVLQLYTGFYYGWFLIFAYGIAAVWVALIPTCRRAVVAVLRDNAWLLVGGAVVAVLALAPWAIHYVAASRLNPSQRYDQVRDWVPRWESWLYMGPDTWWYRWTLDWGQFSSIPGWTNGEHRLGVGLITLFASALGYLAFVRRPWVQLTALVAASLILATTILPGGFNAWRLIFEVVPGADATRTVTRVGLIVLMPMALGLALCVEWLRHHGQVVLALALIAVSTLEQGTAYPTWSKDAGLARAVDVAAGIPVDCRSFLYTPTGDIPPAPDYPSFMYQLDAMWAGLLRGVPTINAYGHNVPTGWEFADPAVRDDADVARIDAALAAWQGIHPEAAPICRVAIEVAP